jgi:TRAP-type C4-dicarboxylate transport system permease small subunit
VERVRNKREPWIPMPEVLSHGPLAVVDRLLCWLVALGMLGMSVVLIIQVVARYFVNNPTVWSEELAIVIFVWTAMLGIAVCVRRGEHLTLDILSKRFHGTSAKILSTFLTALTVITFGLIGYYSIGLLGPASRQVLAGLLIGLNIEGSVAWIYLSIPIGCALSVIFSIERLIYLLRGDIEVLNVDADTEYVEHLDEELAAEGVDDYDPTIELTGQEA